MILKLFRYIFGCYSNTDIEPVFEESNEIPGFISYDEEAMANVTAGKFKFIKYRNLD